MQNMQVKIVGRHGVLSEATQEKIHSKVEKLGRFLDRVSLIEVTVDLEKADNPKVDLRVTTELKKEFMADYQSENLFGCVDQVVDKVEHQMRKFKEKLTEHHKS